MPQWGAGKTEDSLCSVMQFSSLEMSSNDELLAALTCYLYNASEMALNWIMRTYKQWELLALGIVKIGRYNTVT